MMPEAVADVCPSSTEIFINNSNSSVLIDNSNNKISIKNKILASLSKSKSRTISSLTVKAKMSRREENKSPLDFNEDHIDNDEDKSPNQAANRSSSSSPLLGSVSTNSRLLDNLIQTKASNFTENSTTGQLGQLETDKQLIYGHPLFPLLVLLLEKCEIATKSADSQPSANLNEELKVFLQRMQREKPTLFSGDKETNELMILALQVLRIHLLELEKVQELSKDFCNRYICALKGKMQSENLVRNDLGGYESDDSGSGYGGSSSIISARSMAAAAQPMTHLQYNPNEIPGSGSATFLMGPAPGSAHSWMMTADPLMLQQHHHQQQHQQQQQQLQHLQHLHHLRQQPDDSARMVATAASWEMLCKSTVESLDHPDSGDQGFELYDDPNASRSSEKCVSKLASLPSHYANQHLVHHQLTDLGMVQNKGMEQELKKSANGMEICSEILQNLSSAFEADEESNTSTHSPPPRN